MATALCFPISNPSFGLKKRNSECRSLQVNPRDNVPSLNGPLETTAVPTGDHVRRRSPCLVTLGYLNYSGRYKAHTAQVPLCCTGTISTPGNSWVLPYLHLPRSGLSRPHAWYVSGDQRDLRHNCAINERQLLLPRHLNPWRALFRATLLQFYASNFIISIKTQERCSGEQDAGQGLLKCSFALTYRGTWYESLHLYFHPVFPLSLQPAGATEMILPRAASVTRSRSDLLSVLLWSVSPHLLSLTGVTMNAAG